MSLIYKPSSIYMSPMKETVSNTTGFEIRFKMSGYKCSYSEISFLSKKPDGSWKDMSYLFPRFETYYPIGSEKYNDDFISVQVPENFFSNSTNVDYTDSNMGWKAKVVGERLTLSSSVDTDGYYNMQNNGYDTGDEVIIYRSTTFDPPNDVYRYVACLGNNKVRLYLTREASLQNTTGYDTSRTGDYCSAVAVSQIAPFIAINQNNLIIDTKNIDKPTFTFVPKWNKPNVSIPKIVSWTANLYSADGKLVETSGDILDGFMSFRFRYALLNGNSYIVQFIAYDVYQFRYNTGMVKCSVSYDNPSVGFEPTATNDCLNSAINVDWGNAVQIVGKVDGEYEYIDFMDGENTAIKLKPNAVLKYDVDIPIDSPPIFIFSPVDNAFDGKIYSMSNSMNGNYATLSYSQKDNSFLYDINGVVEKINADTIENKIETKEEYNITDSMLNTPDFLHLSLHGTTVQYSSTNATPSFLTPIGISHRVQAYNLPNSSKQYMAELYSCGDIKDKLVIDAESQELISLKQNTTFEGFPSLASEYTLIGNYEKTSKFSFKEPRLIDIKTDTANNLWCNSLIAKNDIDADEEGIYFTKNKDIVFNISNKNFGNGMLKPNANMLVDFLNDMYNIISARVNYIYPRNTPAEEVAYGVTRDTNQTSPLLIRTGLNNNSLIVNVNDETVGRRNDFDNIYPWSKIKVCNVINGKAVAYKGDPDFKTDGSNGNVMVQIPKFYYGHEVDGTTETWWVSEYPADGLSLHPKFTHLMDGVTELPYYYIGAYEGNNEDVDKKLFGSFSNQAYLDFSEKGLKTIRPLINKYYGTGGEYTALDLAGLDLIRLLFIVEFATLKTQGIMNGRQRDYSSYVIAQDATSPYTDGIKIGNMSVANGPRVGTALMHEDGTSYGLETFGSVKSITFNTDGSAIVYVENTKIEDYTFKKGDFLFPTYTKTGMTDKIIGGTGYTDFNENKLYFSPCKYRGIENPWGNMQSLLEGIYTKQKDPSTYMTNYYYCPDPKYYKEIEEEYPNETIPAQYSEITSVPSPIGNGFISDYKSPNSFSYIYFPTQVNNNATKSTYFCCLYNFMTDGTSIGSPSVCGDFMGLGDNNLFSWNDNTVTNGKNGTKGFRLCCESKDLV